MGTIVKTFTGIAIGASVVLLSACSSGEANDLPPELAGGVVAHEKCEIADEEILNTIEEELIVDGAYLDNGQMIVDYTSTFVGASVVDDDSVISRSEVWQVADNGQVYSMSQGAMEYTGLESSPTALMVEEYPDGVDRCVIAATTNENTDS